MIRTRKSLLLRIRDHRDHASWEEFFKLYRPVIRRYAEDQGIPHDDAADIAQEVFLQLMRIHDTFEYRDQAGSFRSWLKTVTRRKVVDWFRRKRSSLLASLQIQSETPDLAPSVADHWEIEERKNLVMSALAQVRRTICHKTWKCFEEHILKQRKASEVAQELQTSENSVYVNSNRVVGRVRECCHSSQQELVHAR